VTDGDGCLTGVLPLRRLVMLLAHRPLAEIVTQQPHAANVNATLDSLEALFDRVDYTAVPVVDDDLRLVGVVRRDAVHEALRERESEDLLKLSGIIGGEELRSLPWWNRTIRRLAFLVPSIALSYAAVSIIACFEPLIAHLTALAIFLPMVANLSGAAGNQAVAVSIRELSLGILRPRDVLQVWRGELLLGLFNGAVIGVLLAGLAILTRSHQPVLAAAIGGAYALNSILAVGLGAALPLILQRIGADPAMLSSPILSTLTDAGAFLLTLSIAALLLGGFVIW
jgi:magnesium transporter